MRAWRWLAPAVLVLLVLTVWPLARAVRNALSTYSLSDPSGRKGSGLATLSSVLGSGDWWSAVAVTLALVVVAVLLQVTIGFGFAVALRRLTVVWPVARVLVLVPFTLLAVSMAVLTRDAVTTGFAAGWFRLDGTGPLGQLVAVTLGEVWRGTGIVTLILLAGFRGVSAPLLDSAFADGATALQRWRRVVLPVVAPSIAVAAAYRALDGLRVLEGPLLADEPGARVRTAAVTIWNTEFSSFELGLGAAMSLVLLVVAGVLGAAMVLLFRVRRVV